MIPKIRATSKLPAESRPSASLPNKLRGPAQEGKQSPRSPQNEWPGSGSKERSLSLSGSKPPSRSPGPVPQRARILRVLRAASRRKFDNSTEAS